MSKPTTDVDLLWEQLEDQPANDTLKLALADCLRESGDTDTACVLAWCVERKRWPVKKTTPSWQRKGTSWMWGCGSNLGEKPKKIGNGLPLSVYWAFPDPGSQYHPRVMDAIIALTKALVTQRNIGPKWS